MSKKLLSPFPLNFTYEELTRTSTGLSNDCPDDLLGELTALAEMLQRIRMATKNPVIVTSAYRSPAVNSRVGSSSTSDHTIASAADILVPRFGAPFTLAQHLSVSLLNLGIGQIIYETALKPSGEVSEWVHVSTRVPDKAVNRILTFDCHSKTFAPGILRVDGALLG